MKAGVGQIDTISSVMNAAGDKLVTNDKGDSNTRCRKGGKAGPAATVKFGSASVPIYLSESKGRKRYFIAHYRDGKRIRQAFPDLVAAKKEALFVAQRIQSGMQHVGIALIQVKLQVAEQDDVASVAGGGNPVEELEGG